MSLYAEEGNTLSVLLYDFFEHFALLHRFLHDEADAEQDPIYLKQVEKLLREFEENNFTGWTRASPARMG